MESKKNIFISFSSLDQSAAYELREILNNWNLSTWFAPSSISVGKSFHQEIGKQLIQNKFDDSENVSKADVLILLLSKNSGKSPWVQKEITTAIENHIPIIPLKIDNYVLNESLKFLLCDIQFIKAPQFTNEVKRKLYNELKKYLKAEIHEASKEFQAISTSDLNIKTISQGDPYFKLGNTLEVHLKENKEFLLSPPKNISIANRLISLSFIK